MSSKQLGDAINGKSIGLQNLPLTKIVGANCRRFYGRKQIGQRACGMAGVRDVRHNMRVQNQERFAVSTHYSC